MKLMSSLLLCTLVALMPRTLDSTILESDVKINDAKIIGLSHSFHLKCTKCINCMERAIRADRTQTRLRNRTPNSEELAHDVLKSRFERKISRKERSAAEATIAAKSMKTKKSKGRTKRAKGVIVTKFHVDGQVYGLKLKETDLNAVEHKTTCTVYSVKKYFPCGSLEGDAMLTSAKRKASIKTKKNQLTKASRFTEEPIENTEPTLRTAKRDVATTSASNTRLPEQYLTSYEEFY